MTRAFLSSTCNCCGLTIRPESGEDCPRCNYPIRFFKEEHFLEFSLRDLQRVSDYGGANQTVSSLIERYRKRLHYLRLLKSGAASASFAAIQQSEIASVPSPMLWHEQVARPSTSVPEMNTVVASTKEAPQLLPRRAFSFSWKSFVVDQAITIIGLLGAFLILMGALSSVVTIGGNPVLSFLIVFGVHAFFGIAGVVAYRFANFRLIARIYSGIYVLLVPLVGFTGYTLLLGSQIPLSVQTAIAVAATYAAIVYFILAIYQGFSIFGYLGTMALIIADLAVAADLRLNFWWWPDMLMLVAFPALASVALTLVTRRERYFSGVFAVLRPPVRFFMYTIIAVCLLSAIVVTFLSFSINGTNTFSDATVGEIRFSILSMTILLSLWMGAWLWLTKRTRELPVLAFMFLACVLAFSYVFNFSQGGYTLTLVGVALLYHMLNRFAGRLLQPFGRLGLYVDQIALLLLCLVPFISSFLLPQQLFYTALHIPLEVASPLYVHANWAAVEELIVVGIGCAIIVSMSLMRANRHGKLEGIHNNWRWLLLLAGFLLNWELSTLLLALNVEAVWYFTGLTLALVIMAVVVRERFGAYWAEPLDVIVLGDMLLALCLSLNKGADLLSALLLGFAALAYSVGLYQRRKYWLFLSLLFAVLALPILIFARPYIALLMGIVLPLAAVAIMRIMAKGQQTVSEEIAVKPAWEAIWEWPFLTVGLLYGMAAALFDVTVSQYGSITQSIVSNWSGVTFPVALELAALSMAWYLSAALVRVKWWLLPVIGFAAGAVLLPSNPFWVLAGVTLAAALLAFGVSRRFDRTWASPLYIVTLLSAVMTGVAGYQNQGQLNAASWILLFFALFAYAIGLAEDLEPCLWLLPVFTAWSLLDAARLGDLYRPPAIALVFAGVGMASGLLKLVPMPFAGASKKIMLLRYALPFYAAAFAAAVLTGVYGMLPNAVPPFYGAIPDALLIYALVAFGVALFERQPGWQVIVAGFAVWATLLATHTTAYYVAAIAVTTGIVGILSGRLIIRRPGLDITASPLVQWQRQFSWNWPWYITSLVAAVVIGLWPFLPVVSQPAAGFIDYSLLVFTALAFLVMLVERVPELLVWPAGFAALAIWLWQPHLDITTMMVAYMALCVLIFVSQFIWKVLSPLTRGIAPALLHNIAGIGGQLLVVFIIVGNGGLFSRLDLLPFVGAGSLFVLALMIFCYGRIQENNRVCRSCDYAAGLLVSLVISWTLSAFGQTNLDLLTLAPATYLAVIAPLLMRDEALPEHRCIGQAIAVAGAALLLLPTLWLSFVNSEGNLLYTLILIGESLVLLLLGIGVGVRVFVLSGAGLIVVAALHALFLPTLGIPTPLALTMLGATLLAIATSMSIVRHKIRSAWSHWD